jgi:hypothetical protein
VKNARGLVEDDFASLEDNLASLKDPPNYPFRLVWVYTFESLPETKRNILRGVWRRQGGRSDNDVQSFMQKSFWPLATLQPFGVLVVFQFSIQRCRLLV